VLKELYHGNFLGAAGVMCASIFMRLRPDGLLRHPDRSRKSNFERGVCGLICGTG
jgi:hypothetical protein